MPLTPDAQKLVLARARAERAARKQRYRERLQRLQQAVQPPLTAAELALGLGLEVADSGANPVSRWLSEAPRLARATPDPDSRALIDALLDGALHLAVERGHLPGRRRQVLVCADKDLPWLASHLAAVNLAGRALGEVGSANTDWDDGALWDPFTEPEAPEIRSGIGEPRALLGRDVFPLVLGTLRLGTAGRPDRPEALALLRAARDAGVEVFDTADTYCLDEEDRGYAESLCVEAVPDATWVTKVGLSRPQGRWVPAGRPEQLTASAEASARRLGRVPLLMLHAPDSAIPFAEQCGALARLQERGVVERVGLCNVSAEQLAEAQASIEVSALQVAASWFSRTALERLGEACIHAGIPLMAHSPLGGHARRGRLAQEPEVRGIATQLGVSPEQVALAWLLSLSDAILPVVGTTRASSLSDSLASAGLELPQSALDRLGSEALRRDLGRARPDEPERVVVLMGPPAAGKTRRVQHYVRRGYQRFNRDERGGRLDDLLAPLRQGLQDGPRRAVLDNTYPTRKSRRGVLEVAADVGVAAEAVQLDVSRPDALRNAAGRILDKLGHLPEPQQLARLGRKDPNLLPPAAIYRWFERYEAPTTSEGFARVEVVPFGRRFEAEAVHKAVFFDLDGTLRGTHSGSPYPHDADDVVLLPGRAEAVRALAAAGWRLVGVTNQGGIARGHLTREVAERAVARTVGLLGVELDVRLCPHGSEQGCWCRKPMPGLGVELVRTHQIDTRKSHMVGDMESDRGFAENLGVAFHSAEAFFGGDWRALC